MGANLLCVNELINVFDSRKNGLFSHSTYGFT